MKKIQRLKRLTLIMWLLVLLLLPLLTSAQKEVLIHITTDGYPTETKWDLFSDSIGGSVLSTVNYGHYTAANTSYTDTIYIADTITDISWVIYDSYGDGIPGGNYYVEVCNDTIIDYPVPTFTTGLIHNRVVPQCMPNPPPCVPANIIINLDQYQEETSWDIRDTNGTIYAASVSYSGNPDYATISVPVCIPSGPLEFNIYDTYGDGLNGALWQGQDGSYYLTQCNDTLVYGTNPAFGNDTVHMFMSDSCVPIYGCMDPDYIEFNHLAAVDTGLCNTLKVFGCLDTTMYNYYPLANTMDMIDSCDYTLVLHDLMGNGWVGSSLKIYADDTTEYYNAGGFDDIYSVSLTAPRLLRAQFFISAQASLTTIECGFTLINPEGDTLISVLPPFIQPLFVYNSITNCGNTCIEKIYGCTYLNAINYDSLANTDDVSCYYDPGCTNPVYLEYNSNYDYDDGSCSTLVVIGCMDSTAFNYVDSANTELPNSCIAVVEGCMQALAFNYNINANTPDTCIAIVYGCMSQLALNYDSLANTDDGSCIGLVYGCTDTLAFNWDPNANVNDSSCVPVIYGCINPTQFNYCDTCNTNDGSCVEILYGCTDSIMFNYNPLANVDNNTCIPFTYGCTDPSALNYNPTANTEDFSCIVYIYGCMDSTSFNYDPTANTDNGSCVDVVQGCMDVNAYNYSVEANVNDSTSCLYNANCITGPGSPYWLNDLCYAWVISVDDYCCENAWDTICQATYDYCEGTWTGPLLARETNEKKLLIITDLLGREIKETNNKVLFYIYDDGTVEKKIKQ